MFTVVEHWLDPSFNNSTDHSRLSSVCVCVCVCVWCSMLVYSVIFFIFSLLHCYTSQHIGT